jgi:hypothetical protein
MSPPSNACLVQSQPFAVTVEFRPDDLAGVLDLGATPLLSDQIVVCFERRDVNVGSSLLVKAFDKMCTSSAVNTATAALTATTVYDPAYDGSRTGVSTTVSATAQFGEVLLFTVASLDVITAGSDNICQGTVPAIPATSIAPTSARSGLRIPWPRLGDVVYGNTVVLNVVHTEGTSVSDGSSTHYTTGDTVCLTYSYINDAGSAGVSQTGCVVSTGEFVEFGIPDINVAKNVSIVVKVETGPYAGSTAATWITLQPARDDDDDDACHQGTIPPTSPQTSLVEIPVLLVLSHYNEDVTWLQSSPFPSIIFSKASTHPTAHHAVPKNVASEATAYLTFIIQYYDNLPKSMVFLHSHRYSYHSEDLLILLPIMKAKIASGLTDFVNEYCNINSAVWGVKEGNRAALKTQWDSWMHEYLGSYNKETTWGIPVYDRCCAQFIVGRERILLRPKQFYVDALDMCNEATEGAEDSRTMGLTLEWIWHVVFGESHIVPQDDVASLLDKVDMFDQATLEHRPWCLR